MNLFHLINGSFFAGAGSATIPAGGVLTTFPPHFFLYNGAGTPTVSESPVATKEKVKHRYIYDRHYPSDGIPTAAAPVAEFTWDAVTNPPTVYFQFAGVNPTFFLWDFGDSSSSVERDPIHVYQQAPDTTVDYTVSLTVAPGVTVIHIVTVTTENVLSLYTLTLPQLDTLTLDELDTLPLSLT